MNATEFRLVITFPVVRKGCYASLLKWLFQKEVFTFSWEFCHRDGKDLIEVTIEGCWAACLSEIASMLPDIKETG